MIRLERIRLEDTLDEMSKKEYDFAYYCNINILIEGEFCETYPNICKKCRKHALNTVKTMVNNYA